MTRKMMTLNCIRYFKYIDRETAEKNLSEFEQKKLRSPCFLKFNTIFYFSAAHSCNAGCM